MIASLQGLGNGALQDETHYGAHGPRLARLSVHA